MSEISNLTDHTSHWIGILFSICQAGMESEAAIQWMLESFTNGYADSELKRLSLSREACVGARGITVRVIENTVTFKGDEYEDEYEEVEKLSFPSIQSVMEFLVDKYAPLNWCSSKFADLRGGSWFITEGDASTEGSHIRHTVHFEGASTIEIRALARELGGFSVGSGDLGVDMRSTPFVTVPGIELDVSGIELGIDLHKYFFSKIMSIWVSSGPDVQMSIVRAVTHELENPEEHALVEYSPLRGVLSRLMEKPSNIKVSIFGITGVFADEDEDGYEERDYWNKDNLMFEDHYQDIREVYENLRSLYERITRVGDGYTGELSGDTVFDQVAVHFGGVSGAELQALSDAMSGYR